MITMVINHISKSRDDPPFTKWLLSPENMPGPKWKGSFGPTIFRGQIQPLGMIHNQVPCHGMDPIQPSRLILNLVKPTQPTLNQLSTYESWDDPSKSLTFLFLFRLEALIRQLGVLAGDVQKWQLMLDWEREIGKFFRNAKVGTGEKPGQCTPWSTNIQPSC